MLNQSDLLVVVWDGDGNNKRGGTYETLQEAMTFGVPALWVDARAPHPWQLLLKECDLPVCTGERCIPQRSGTPDFQPVVDGILGLPAPAAATAEKKHLRTPDLRAAFFAERKPERNPAFVWKLFRDLVGSLRLAFPHWRVQDFEEAAAAEWPTGDNAKTKVERWVNARLIGHYAWADKLADLYADKYRSAFVTCYLYGALAVMLALVPHSFPWTKPLHDYVATTCAVLELLVVGRILSLVWLGNKRHWHDRWMAYRLMAELVRQLRFLIPLGGGRPFAHSQTHHRNYGNPTNSWMYWHFRAIDREVGLPRARVTSTYLRDCLGYVAHVAQNQINFHYVTADRSKRIEHRLHGLGLFLFGATAFIIASHVFLHFCLHFILPPGETWHDVLERYGLTFFCASLPAIGAALAAISNQGEFTRIARRSSAMEEQLKHMSQDLEQFLKAQTMIRSRDATNHALRIAQTMVDEVLDWRVVFLDRPARHSGMILPN